MVDILRFKVGDRLGGLPLGEVAEVLRAMTITPLPMVPNVIEGIINVRGAIIPVVDLYARLRLPPPELVVTDRLVLVRSEPRPIALRVAEAGEVVPVDEEEVEEVIGRASEDELVAGAAKLKDGVLLIYDVNAFLSDTEAGQLEQALAESGY